VLAEADGRFGLSLNFETKEIGFAVYERCGTTLPDDVLARAREVDGVILGPVSHLDYPPRDQGGVNDLFRSNRVESCTAALGCTHHPLFVIRVLDYASFHPGYRVGWRYAPLPSPPWRLYYSGGGAHELLRSRAPMSSASQLVYPAKGPDWTGQLRQAKSTVTHEGGIKGAPPCYLITTLSGRPIATGLFFATQTANIGGKPQSPGQGTGVYAESTTFPLLCSVMMRGAPPTTQRWPRQLAQLPALVSWALLRRGLPRISNRFSLGAGALRGVGRS
jgi:hypothetical protein